MANAQLALLPSHGTWKLSEDTKRIGRAGLAHARAMLAQTPEPTGLLPRAGLSAPLEDPAPVQPSVVLRETSSSEQQTSPSIQLDLIAA